MPADSATAELYRHDHLYGRKKFLTLTGASIHLRAPDGRLLAFSRQKAFRLKEDIRVFTDEEMTDPLLNIQAQSIIDFGASYRVTDARTGELYGSLRRKGFSSMLRDHWEILDPAGAVRGQVREDSAWKAIVRRLNDFVALLLPQAYDVIIDGKVVATMRQDYNVFAPKIHIDLSGDGGGLPRPLAVATVILLLAIEGKQG